jgi:hypothetical protein
MHICNPLTEYRSWSNIYNSRVGFHTQDTKDASNRRIACYVAMIFVGMATLAVGTGCFLAGCTFTATVLALCPVIATTILFHDLYQKNKALLESLLMDTALRVVDGAITNWKKSDDPERRKFAVSAEDRLQPQLDPVHKGRNGQFSAAELKAREDALYENTLVWKHLRKFTA